MTRRPIVTLLVLAGSVVVLLFVTERGRGRLMPWDPVVGAAQDDERVEPQEAALSAPDASTISAAEEPETRHDLEASSAAAARRGRRSPEEREEARLELMVVAAEDGRPLDNIHVRDFHRGESEYGGSSTTRTDGRYTWRGPPGDYDFVVGGGWRNEPGPHFDPIDTEKKLVQVDGLRPAEQRSLTIAVHTVPDRLHHLRFVDSLTEEPVPAAWVDIFDPQLESLEDVDARCTRIVSDSEGQAACWIPSWRAAPARIGSPDHVPRFTFLSTTPTTRDAPEIVAVEPWPTLEVALLDGRARPAADLRVRAVQGETTFDARTEEGESLRLPGASWVADSDRDGVARFEHLLPGVPVCISIARDIAFDRVIPSPVTLSPGEIRRVAYGLSETSLTGVVRNAEGRPVAELSIWLLPAKEQPHPGAPFAFADEQRPLARATTTDRAGRFSFADVPPGGWWVGPTPPGDPPRHVFASIATAVEVRPENGWTEVDVTAADGR